MSAAPAPEVLGTVTFPTGDLLLLDFGLLRLWSHDRPPHIEDGVLPPEVAAGWNDARDHEIVGPDAGQVAAVLDLAMVKGRYAFDQRDADSLRQRVDTIRAERGWSAEVREVPRMPHLDRVRALLADAPDGTEVPFPGGWAVAVRGLPAGPLEVRGTRMPDDGPDAGRWHSVWVQVGDAEPVRSIEAGHVLVDEARLMFTDPTALGGYLVNGSYDGLGDLVFWGRDAAEVAARLEAPATGDTEFGWVDVDWPTAQRLLDRLDEARGAGAKFAHDVRVHNDDYRLLAQARTAATESGSLDLAGGTVTGFFTTWGDGAFPVLRDLAADGSLCRVRVELGGPATVALARRMEEEWFGPLSLLAVASTRITRDGAPVGWLQREEPRNDRDSGWQLFAGDESQDYLDDPDNIALLPLRELLRIDPTVEQVLSAPAPCGFERDGDGWRDISDE